MKPLYTATALALATLLSTGAAIAQVQYPVDSVRIMVPANPGGSTDVNARIFGEYFQKHSTASTAIVNQAAGGGVVAAQTVATSPADGSVLYIWHAAVHTTNLSGQSPFAYTDLTPLATTAEYNDVYAVRADAPYSTLPELADHARANPQAVTIGSQFGGTTQIKGDAINALSDGNMRVVDAGGESDRIIALLGEQVDVISMSVANARQYAEDGQIKVLAVINERADPFAPDFPTTASQGVDISFPLVFTVYGPPNMDDATIAAFEEVLAAMEADPEYLAALEAGAQVPAIRASAATAEFLASELDFVRSLMAD
ncbi:tripartite tricarboxylate transporter substrate binding protein [Arsenicitalea aurantiaca]|uniref:Tripartite tricarboxylate transporter substrate binding protein n=1 Tax=Arsenicitalea aurantiaca TaxID=1783274 RepID=A0A433XAZ6_9HYPH|nr:tripartite tricarboxylate transporter substrate binding protein [Arsenicitalea aurantiaca]RUT31271.1 tripartite tricarboxylate transporter substrate binding protein [Arsenicitalea aurantiaca]